MQKSGVIALIGIRHRFAIVIIAMVAIFSLTFNSASAKDSINVGMAVALTGYLASFDGQLVDGVKLAVKHINDAGGVNGKDIKLHILDNASNAATGVTIVNQLLNQYNVSVMITGASSAQSVAIHPIAAKNKVPFISTAMPPPNPTWVFLAGPYFETIIETQLQFVKQRLKGKKIVYVYLQNPFGQLGANYVAKRAPELGLEVVLSQGVEGSTIDLTPQMGKFKDLMPDAIVDLLTGPVHIVEAKAAATVGLQIPIVRSTDDSSVAAQSATAYPNSYGVMLPVQAYPDLPDPEVKAANATFVAAYKAAGLDPVRIAGGAWGWDAVNTLVLAIKASGATGGEELRAGLEKVSFVASTGRLKFSASDHTGQAGAPSPLQIGRYRDGKLEILFPK